MAVLSVEAHGTTPTIIDLKIQAAALFVATSDEHRRLHLANVLSDRRCSIDSSSLAFRALRIYFRHFCGIVVACCLAKEDLANR